MKIIPRKEILKYVGFKNGEVIVEGELPPDLQPLFDEYRRQYYEAEKYEQERPDNLVKGDFKNEKIQK